jgi:hypothetical protein
LHNRFFFDEPKVYFMHIGGEGDTATLARRPRRRYSEKIRASDPQPAQTFTS